MLNTDPIISVCIITYNHELYIQQAIQSVINQSVSFNYEIIIFDDCSTDDTKNRIDEILLKSSNLENIKYIRHEKNIGMLSNLFYALRTCKGKYIAFCEGDDYWIDNFKLQIQLDILENNIQYSGCFHNTIERIEENDIASYLYCNYKTGREISFKDLSLSNIIPTCSVLFRKKNVENLPNWFKELRMLDWPINLLNAERGNFYYIPKVMGVHRHSIASTWSTQSQNRNIKLVIDAYDILIEGFKHNKLLHNQLKRGKIIFKLTSKYYFVRLIIYLSNKITMS